MSIDLDTLPIILAHVPVWVWLLFAWLVYSGLCALRDREQRVARLAIVPVVFILWGLSNLLLGHHGTTPVLVWLACAVVLAPAGLLSGRRLRIEPARGLVHRPGSVLPLVRNVALFAAQLWLGIAMAMDPDHRDTLVAMKSALSGAMAGYFLGWALALYRAARPAA